jgi:hypothetical protein
MVLPRPHYYEFLTKCVSIFDIGIWSSMTQPNLIPIVDLLLGEGSKIKLIFIWGVKKCKQIPVSHSLNPRRQLVLKKMSKVFQDISLRFYQLFHKNTLLIDDCPFKCMANAPFSYVLPKPFNNDVMHDNNYLMGTLWPYLVGLFEAPNACEYVGSNHHG